METRVFVVLNQDIGMPGVIVGAAADLDSAYEIAERHAAWHEDVKPAWIVDLDTGVHSRRWAGVWQEIVRVPLARGSSMWDGSTDPIADLRAHRGKSMARLGYPQPLDIADQRPTNPYGTGREGL